jgi:putative ABC transport system ATP-binding protein
VETLYRLEGVVKTYGRGEALVRAIDRIDIEIAAGEFIVIAGPSGSGKSTLLQLLGALDRPGDGQIEFEGRDLGRLGDNELADLRLKTLGFIFQQFNLIPTLSARENVDLAMAPAARSAGSEKAAPSSSWTGSGSGLVPATFPRSSPAASNSALPSLARSRTAPTSCSPTSRPETSTPRPARRS